MIDNLKECIRIGLANSSDNDELTDFRINSIKEYMRSKHELYELSQYYFLNIDTDLTNAIINVFNLLDKETNEKLSKLKYLIASECIGALLNDNQDRFSVLLYHICESSEEATLIKEACIAEFDNMIGNLKERLKERYKDATVLYYNFEVYKSACDGGVFYYLHAFISSENSLCIEVELHAIRKELKENGINTSIDDFTDVVADYIFLHGDKVLNYLGRDNLPEVFKNGNDNSDDKLFKGMLCRFLALNTACLITDIFRKHLAGVVNKVNKLYKDNLYFGSIDYAGNFVCDAKEVSLKAVKGLVFDYMDALVKEHVYRTEKEVTNNYTAIRLPLDNIYTEFKQEIGKTIIPISDRFAGELITNYVKLHLLDRMNVSLDLPKLHSYFTAFTKDSEDTRESIEWLCDEHLGKLVNLIDLKVDFSKTMENAYLDLDMEIKRINKI